MRCLYQVIAGFFLESNDKGLSRRSVVGPKLKIRPIRRSCRCHIHDEKAEPRLQAVRTIVQNSERGNGDDVKRLRAGPTASKRYKAEPEDDPPDVTDKPLAALTRVIDPSSFF